MKKLGFIIAFCSLFALGLSAQDPQVKKKTDKVPKATTVQGAVKNTTYNAQRSQMKKPKLVPRTAAKPAQSKPKPAATAHH